MCSSDLATVADLSTVEPTDLALAGEEAAEAQLEHIDRWGPVAEEASPPDSD